MSEYVCVTDKNEDDAMEIPADNDGTILLSTLKAQYPDAIGLKYKVESRYRAIRLANDQLYPPADGWGDRVYYCTFKTESESSSSASKKAPAETSSSGTSGASGSQNTDLIVLGLPWHITDTDLRDYFETFGTLEFATVKIDKNTGRSKGFGFIRYNNHEAALKAMMKRHKIGNRFCDVRVPESTKVSEEPVASNKVFVGSLKSDITDTDLREYFEQYGTVTEVFIPKPFREFAFVRFESDEVAKSLLNQHFNIKDSKAIVTEATPKRIYNNNDNNKRGYNNFGNNNMGGGGHNGGNNNRRFNDNYNDDRQNGGGGNNYNNNKRQRRNDFDDYSSQNNYTPDVIQAVVSKAVSEVLNNKSGGGNNSISPWGSSGRY